MKYNYYFSCVEHDDVPAQEYSFTDSDVHFSYVRNVNYSGANNFHMCSLILESLSVENDVVLNNLFDYLKTLHGGILTVRQCDADTKVETFVIKNEVLAASVSVNNGFNVLDQKNTRGFALSLKVDFNEVS